MTPTLEIEGIPVEVDDKFLSLPLAEQHATVEEIASHPSFLARAAKARLLSTTALQAPAPAPAATAAPSKPTSLDDLVMQAGGNAIVRATKQPVSDQLNGFERGMGNLGRQVADGGTFGLVDKGLAALKTAAGAGDYASNVAAERAQTQQFAKENPTAALGAQLLGGILTGGGMAKGAGALLESASPLARAAGTALSPVTAVGELESPLARTLAYGAALPAEGFAYGAANEAGHMDNARPDELAIRMLAGGGAGALTTGVLGGLAIGAGGVASRFGGGGADAAAGINPTTGKPFTKAEAALAARAMQDSTVGAPADVAAEIGQNAQGFRDEGLPVPTAGALTRDLGMRQTDATLRSKAGAQGKDILQRDAEVATAARDQLESAAPAGADPQDTLNYAQNVADARRDVAQRRVDKAAGEAKGVDMAMEEAGKPVGAMQDPAPVRDAIRRLDPAMEAEHQKWVAEQDALARQPVDEAQSRLASAEAEKGRLADELAPLADRRVAEDAGSAITDAYSTLRDQENTRKSTLYNDLSMRSAQVPREPLALEVGRMRADLARDPSLDPSKMPTAIMNRIGDWPADVPFTYGHAQNFRSDLSELRAEAVKNNQGQLARNAQRLLDVIDQYPEMLASQGNPAGEAAQLAKQNYAENFAPNFREGVGGALDRGLRSGSPVRPSDVGRRFIANPEAAADLARLSKLEGAPADLLDYGRQVLMNDLASSGAVRNRQVNPEALQRWLDAKGSIPDTLGARDKLTGLLDRAQRTSSAAEGAGLSAKEAEGAYKARSKELAATEAPSLGRAKTADDIRAVIEKGGPTAIDDAKRMIWQDMATSGVLKDGKVDANALRNWNNRLGGKSQMLDAVPGMRQEFNDILRQSARGQKLSSQWAGELQSAQEGLKLTEKDIQKSAAGQMLGKDADHAIASMMESDNPAQRMAQAVDLVKNNQRAKDGLKKAFVDWLIDKATNENTSKTLDGRGGVSPAKINAFWDQHRETAAKLFSPDEMNAIQRAHKLAMTEQARNVQKTSGSPSAERLADQQADDVVKGVHLLPIGIVGKGMALLGKALSALPNAEKGAKELQVRSLLDPETIQYLLNRDTKSPRMPSWIPHLAARAATLEPSILNDLRRDSVPQVRRSW